MTATYVPELQALLDTQVRKLHSKVYTCRRPLSLSCGCRIQPGERYIHAATVTNFNINKLRSKRKFHYWKLHFQDPCQKARVYFPTYN